MNDIYKIQKAIDYAAIAHNKQEKKTTGIPKITHLFGVASILMSYGYEDDIIIAGLLHDVIEDCKNYTIVDIEKNFGKEVARLVLNSSEKDKTKIWKERKLDHLEEIKKSDLKTKIVVTADKIQNVSSLIEDTNTYGIKIWKKFNANKEEIKWYYKEMYNVIIKDIDKETPIIKEYKRLLDEMELL